MDCCNKNHQTWGLICGSIYLLASLTICVLSVVVFVDGEHRHEFPTEYFAASLVAAIVSAFFILAVVKNYYILVIPWLILCVLGFPATCFIIFILYFVASLANFSDCGLILLLLLGVCVLVIEIAILIFSCFLFREMRQKNLDKSINVPASYQKETLAYNSKSEGEVI